MINFRINTVEKNEKIIHCYIQVKRMNFWRKLRYPSDDTKILKTYIFENVQEAEQHIKNNFFDRNISIITRRILTK